MVPVAYRVAILLVPVLLLAGVSPASESHSTPVSPSMGSAAGSPPTLPFAASLGFGYTEGNISLGLYEVGDSWVTVNSTSGGVFVSNGVWDSVTLVQPATNTAGAPRTLGGGTAGLAYDPANGNIYVATGPDQVEVLSGATGQPIGSITVAASPVAVTYDSINGDLYVACEGASVGDGVVSVIQGSDDQLLTNISVPGVLEGIAYDSVDRDIYVSVTNAGYVEAISDVSNSVVSNIQVAAEGSGPAGLVYDPSTGMVYVAMTFTNNLTVFDAATGEVMANVSLAENPEAVAIDPVSGDVYVTSKGEGEFGNVTVVNATTYSVVATITTPYGSEGIAFDPVDQVFYVASAYFGSVTWIRPLVRGDLLSVALQPASATLDPGTNEVFNAIPSCWETACGGGISYAWSQSPVLGTLSSDSADPMTFTAGAINGTELLMVNATAQGLEFVAPAAQIGVGVSLNLTGVSISPSTLTLYLGGDQVLTAAATCAGAPCAAGVSYQWALSNSVGQLESQGRNVTFIAGPTAGSGDLNVSASLNGGTVTSTPVMIDVSSMPVPTLSSVNVDPPAPSLNPGQTVQFVAHLVCSGGNCPAGAEYSWSLTGGVGTLNSTSGASVNFNAGTFLGTGRLFVNVTLNDRTSSGFATITIVTHTTSSRGVVGWFGSTGGGIVVIGLVALAAAGVAVVWIFRRRRNSVRPPP